jgi:hypothetical protein
MKALAGGSDMMYRNSIFLLLAWAPAAVAADGPIFRHQVSVAHLLEVKGSVTIHNAEGGQRPAQPFGTVYENDSLVLKDDSLVVLGFRANRKMIRLKGPGKLVANKTGVDRTTGFEEVKIPDQHQVAVDRVLGELPTVTRAGTMTVRSLDPSSGPTAGKSNSDGLTPIHRTTVLDREPTLSWPPVPKTYYYEVIASAADGTQLWSATTRSTVLVCKGERTLRNGIECNWTVTAALSDGSFHRAYAGKFTMATAEQVAAASQVRAFTAATESSYSVLAAIWYTENGYITEAIEITERMIDAATASGATAAAQEAYVRKFLYRLYRLAGRHDDAREVLQQIVQSAPPSNGPTPAPRSPK